METATKKEIGVFLPDKIYSVEEYLSIEGRSVEKHEFFNGEVIKMPGASPIHNLIAGNIITELNLALRGRDKRYFVLTSDTKIHVARFKSFVYPDAVVVCENIELYPGSTTIITNPLLVVEVLSSSTSEHDRQGKFHEYKQLPSFKEYLLIEQRMPYVVASFKTAERTWQDTEVDDFQSSIFLRSLECKIEMKNIYSGVEFPGE